MTEHKLLKYIGRRFDPPTGEKLLTPIVRTDSKGKYILRQSIEKHGKSQKCLIKLRFKI
jgi:hypothetical protein